MRWRKFEFLSGTDFYVRSITMSLSRTLQRLLKTVWWDRRLPPREVTKRSFNNPSHQSRPAKSRMITITTISPSPPLG
jgi:hypothetical protein